MNPTPDCVDQHDMDDDGTPDHLDPCPTDPNDRCDYPGVIEALTNLAISVVRFVGVVIDKVAETLSFGAELIWHFASILFCAIFSSSDICNLEESSVGDEDESG